MVCAEVDVDAVLWAMLPAAAVAATDPAEDVDAEGEGSEEDECSSDYDAFEEYRQEQIALGGEGDAFDAEGVKDCTDDGNPTAASCFMDLYSESDEGGDRVSVSTAGEGRSCCQSSERENEDSDCESFGEEECSIGSRALVEELAAHEGGCKESRVVVDVECLAMGCVGEAVLLLRWWMRPMQSIIFPMASVGKMFVL